ncbi:hypothetical protein LSUE1_G005676, partial [Lachnellula suecica]
YLLASLVLSLTAASVELSVRTVYQFASNDTWLENVAVRSNGIILTTEIGPPASILAFDPRESNATKQVLMTFDTAPSLSGITEGAHDVFYVTGANTTFDNIEDPPTNATHVWQVDFNQNTTTTQNTTKPAIKLVARPEAPTGFNGMAAFNENIILASATYQDSIFAVDVTTGRTWEAIKDDLMTQINGIKVQDGFVYWTVGGDFCRAKLYPNVTAGTGEIIAKGSAFDDFALSPNGFKLNTTVGNSTKYAYAATAGYNSILQISFNSKDGGMNETETIAGSEYSTEIAEPTGAAFGRGVGQLNKLYVTTGSGSGENVDVNGVATAVGAQLLEIQLS